MFGMSVVVGLDRVWVLASGEEIAAEGEERPAQALTRVPVARVRELLACDVVDEPAANRNGLFSAQLWASNEDAAAAFAELDTLRARWGVSLARAYDFALAYFAARGVEQAVEQADGEVHKENAAMTDEHDGGTAMGIGDGGGGEPAGGVREAVTALASLPAGGGDRLWLDVPLGQPAGAAVVSGAAGASGPALAEMAEQVAALRRQVAQERVERLVAAAGLSAAGQAMVREALDGWAYAGDENKVAALIEAQRKVEAGLLGRQLVQGIEPLGSGRGAGRLSGMRTPAEDLQDAVTWAFGDPTVKTPPPAMRNIRDLYLALTGDVNFYGIFDPQYAQLAAASTTTLPGMAVNALNKVVRFHYDNLATYRWYEEIVDVVPHDGTTNPVQLIMVDGVANLSKVLEGAAYTELPVGDSRETVAFDKNGNYIGVTLEMFRRSEIARLQAIPRLLMQAAIRTRSAAIAALFTANSGVGPTLADDSTALFHANHGNVNTTVFSDTAWAAARSECFKQIVPGTGKRLGLWPRFCLVPIDLYDTALTTFGYGSGDVGKPNSGGTAQTVNPYASDRPVDPRPIPVAVPEWTDSTDWAYLVDTRLHPVLCMAYANNPQGGSHVLPEFYAPATSDQSSGLLFSHDTLPVKVRDWWGYGVSTYVGVGKRNVAG